MVAVQYNVVKNTGMNIFLYSLLYAFAHLVGWGILFLIIAYLGIGILAAILFAIDFLWVTKTEHPLEQKSFWKLFVMIICTWSLFFRAKYSEKVSSFLSVTIDKLFDFKALHPL